MKLPVKFRNRLEEIAYLVIMWMKYDPQKYKMEIRVFRQEIKPHNECDTACCIAGMAAIVVNYKCNHLHEFNYFVNDFFKHDKKVVGSRYNIQFSDFIMFLFGSNNLNHRPAALNRIKLLLDSSNPVSKKQFDLWVQCYNNNETRAYDDKQRDMEFEASIVDKFEKEPTTFTKQVDEFFDNLTKKAG